jgi:V8-like Glu-specific endopeptidase
MKAKSFILFSLAVLLLVFSGASHLEGNVCGETIYPDIKTPHPYPRATTDSLVWTETIHRTGAGWLKIHFSDFKLNDNDYVVLYDMQGLEVERIKGSDVENPEKSRFTVIAKEGDRVDFWGPAIDGDEVRIELHRSADKRTGWGFSIDQVGVGFWPFDEPIGDEIVEVESICGTDDKVDIKCAATADQTRGLAVGRMLFQSKGSWYVCTGFLVSSCSSHFLTNEHCITSQRQVDTLQVRFKYRYTTCGGGTLDSYTTYYGGSYVTDSRSYDYCLLTLQGTPQATYGYLGLLNRAPVVNESIYIIQHPGGNPQEIGYGTVYNTTANSGKDLGYYVDTEGGSSGSPVLAGNEDKVLGLHHYGGCPNSGVKMDLIYEAIIGYICN